MEGCNEMEYTKKLVLGDLKHKLDEIRELQNSLSWIIDNYEKGVLPE